jgi:hypothetical protein
MARSSRQSNFVTFRKAKVSGVRRTIMAAERTGLSSLTFYLNVVKVTEARASGPGAAMGPIWGMPWSTEADEQCVAEDY